MSGTLFVVATPIGNLEDISARALRVLREVGVIAAEDTRRTARLLARYAIATPTTSLHEHNEVAKAPKLVARLEGGESIALVSDAGTPGVSDPGFRLIRLAIEADIRIEAIPGPSAVIAALAASGLPADRFAFLGFPPTRPPDRKSWFNALASEHKTVVFFEAPHRIERTMGELLEAVGDVEVAVGRELTKVHENWVRGPITTVVGRLESRGEFTVVVNIGQKTETVPVESLPTDGEIAAQIGRLIESGQFSRRSAAAVVAERYHMTANEAYAAAERARRSSND